MNAVNAPARSEAGTTPSRAGGIAGLVCNLLLLFLVNVRPGWDVVPFLSPAFDEVLPWVNASLAVGVLAGLLVALTGSPTVKAAGDAASAAVGAWSLMRFWQVFPFDLSSGWQFAFRAFLVLGMIGCLAGFVTAIVTLLRTAAR